MTLLSVNVNKVATLRNSRGGDAPNLARAVDVIIDAGARGITVHPRADERHIRRTDVAPLRAQVASRPERVEFNIEGDPRRDLMELVLAVVPDQCTLVPVRPGEVTSEAGWRPEQGAEVRAIIPRLRGAGVRVSVFVEADERAIDWATDVGADRVELYTEPYARACERGEQAAAASFARFVDVATYAHARGLGINAGHDLDEVNLALFRTLPHLDEVSIGHAIMSAALFDGLHAVVRRYLAVVGADTVFEEPSRG